ncbi:uncharacterized protein N7518_007682 [Penicillium psychrosexuale]|uniref:uncharacterized protein n=1 Tax=Penicillium psychrosexuale TaxID=1002107 RepID=UPI00254598B8|nr:uncharacterized protein N7518_007682 [Penicillium psychrosexuale]KAJ5790671.1 hypothetical protein N7518_007682 [Penicillium psychrosexuale]
MTTAPPVHHSGPDSGIPGHLVNHLPRYHPIAMNPNPPPHQMPPPEQMVQSHHFRHFAPPMHEHHPQGIPPIHSPASLEHIEARLRHLEHEEMVRNATRSRVLAMRKHEDEEFRSMTERAEAEEETTEKVKERVHGTGPQCRGRLAASPAYTTSPIIRDECSNNIGILQAANTPEPRQEPLPPSSQAPPPSMPPPHMHAQPHHQAPPPPPPSQHQHPMLPHDSIQIHSAGSIRRKQKYTIKNVEAWGERHGRPAAHDPSGRALWKRPSDGSLVYLTCPIHGCGKSDFVTLHGFMCHLTKKHKDRTLGSQSRALEVCGVVYDPNAPLPPVMNNHRASTEGSPLGSNPLDPDGDQHYEDMDSESEGELEREGSYRVKTEVLDRFMPDAEGTPIEPAAATPPSTQPMDQPSKSREALATLPPSESGIQGPSPTSTESSVPSKRKYEFSPPAEKENAEP